MGDGVKSVENFDRVLNEQGIVSTKEGKSESESADQDSNGTLDTEFFLVEAPVEQIDSTMAACHVDVFHCPTIQVVDKSEQPQPIADRLRKWQRSSGEQPTKQEELSIARGKQNDNKQYGKAIRLDQSELAAAKPAASSGRNMQVQPRMAFTRQAADDLVRVLFVLQPAADLRKPIEVETDSAE